MNSFINLMGSDRWTSADISNRFRALRDSALAPEKQLMYTQILLAGVARQRAMSRDEQARIAEFAAYGAQLDALAVKVSAEVVLLHAVLDFEEGLTAEPLTGEALALYVMRHPLPGIEGDAS